MRRAKRARRQANAKPSTCTLLDKCCHARTKALWPSPDPPPNKCSPNLQASRASSQARAKQRVSGSGTNPNPGRLSVSSFDSCPPRISNRSLTQSRRTTPPPPVHTSNPTCERVRTNLLRRPHRIDPNNPVCRGTHAHNGRRRTPRSAHLPLHGHRPGRINVVLGMSELC